jgi:uncharacterized protein YjbJ (UPF0337 family)
MRGAVKAAQVDAKGAGQRGARARRSAPSPAERGISVTNHTKEIDVGIIEEAKGKAKEVVGDITDNAELQEEGAAQKEKGEAEREASEARAKAKAHEAEAKEKELEQKAAQEAK